LTSNLIPAIQAPYKKALKTAEFGRKPAGGSSAWRKPAGGSSAWHKPAGGSSAWHKPAGGSSAWRKPAGGSPAWHKPAGGSSAWRKPAGGSSAWRKPASCSPEGSLSRSCTKSNTHKVGLLPTNLQPSYLFEGANSLRPNESGVNLSSFVNCVGGREVRRRMYFHQLLV
jgi:hypothetical protein